MKDHMWWRWGVLSSMVTACSGDSTVVSKLSCKIKHFEPVSFFFMTRVGLGCSRRGLCSRCTRTVEKKTACGNGGFSSTSLLLYKKGQGKTSNLFYVNTGWTFLLQDDEANKSSFSSMSEANARKQKKPLVRWLPFRHVQSLLEGRLLEGSQSLYIEMKPASCKTNCDIYCCS